MKEIKNINGFIRIDCSKLRTIIANKRERIHKRLEELKADELKRLSEESKVEREKIQNRSVIGRFFTGKRDAFLLQLDDYEFLRRIYMINDDWSGDYEFDREYGRYSPSKTYGAKILNILDELETSIINTCDEQMFVNSSTLQRIS